MFDKAQLIERGKHYFNDKNRKVIYATTDGHFFNEEHFASSHIHGKELEVIKITGADLNKKDKKVEKEEVKINTPENNEATEDNVENRYEEYKEETGKNAVWCKKETRAYAKWIEDN